LYDYSRKEKLEDLIARFTQNLTATKNIIIRHRKNPEDTRTKRRSRAHLVGPIGPTGQAGWPPPSMAFHQLLEYSSTAFEDESWPYVKSV
jgi:hypothetical protein